MLMPRVIPCLLLKEKGLVKTTRFRNPNYVGDPINAIKIFNEKEVDELIFLDIAATKEGRTPPYEMIEQIASECFMPVCYGGGISTIEDIEKIFKLGIEKVSINTRAVEDSLLIGEASKTFGSQSIVVSIDVRKRILGKFEVVTRNGTKKSKLDPVQYAAMAEDMGAGELLVNSVDRDGTGKGYHIDLVKNISQAVTIPVIACGGAGKMEDIRDVICIGGASAAAVGSLFVFYGKHRAVLINYPERKALEMLFSNLKKGSD